MKPFSNDKGSLLQAARRASPHDSQRASDARFYSHSVHVQYIEYISLLLRDHQQCVDNPDGSDAHYINVFSQYRHFLACGHEISVELLSASAMMRILVHVATLTTEKRK